MKVQQILADVLGIEWRGKPVRGFEVDASDPHGLVTVTVHYTITRADQVQPAPKAFRLTAIDPPQRVPAPFDLDRMCEEARERVHEAIEASAHAAKWRVRHFGQLRRRPMDEEIDVTVVTDESPRFEVVRTWVTRANA